MTMPNDHSPIGCASCASGIGCATFPKKIAPAAQAPGGCVFHTNPVKNLAQDKKYPLRFVQTQTQSTNVWTFL